MKKSGLKKKKESRTDGGISMQSTSSANAAAHSVESIHFETETFAKRKETKSSYACMFGCRLQLQLKLQKVLQFDLKASTIHIYHNT